MMQVPFATQNIKVTQFIQVERTMSGVVIPTLQHGDTWMHITELPIEQPLCDGLITDNMTLKLGVYTADCAAICFGNKNKLAIAHVGWRGLCANILQKIFERFEDSVVDVYVGPHYHTLEFQKDVSYKHVTKSFGEDFFERRDGKIFFQFNKALKSRMPVHANFDVRDTKIDLSLPSYRRTKEKTQMLITVVESACV